MSKQLKGLKLETCLSTASYHPTLSPAVIMNYLLGHLDIKNGQPNRPYILEPLMCLVLSFVWN